VAVVGGGPAGLAAAYHLARLGYPVMVFDAHDRAGGLLRYGIPPYRLPRTVLDRELAALFAWGITFRGGRRLGTNLLWDEVAVHDAVFLATGLAMPRRLGVPGEEHPRVLDGLAFLERAQRGAAVALGAHVVVIGGGNTAVDAARTARRHGAAATILYRRTRGEMPAIAAEVEAALEEGVALEAQAVPASIRGATGRLAVAARRTEPGSPDAAGRRVPRTIPGTEFTLLADTVIAAVGEAADTTPFPAGIFLPEGPAVVAAGCTALPRVFVGGDFATRAGSVAAAVGDGARIARRIHRYLEGEAWAEDAPPPIPFADLHLEAVRPVRRARAPRLPAGDRLRGFNEVEGGLDAAAAPREAARCLHCGACSACDLCWALCPDAAIVREVPAPGERLVHYRIDLAHCKGCGICAAECPCGAIAMEGAR
jgi:NADPH-dependent glutamate synthase beta subunit-like oxidoreductase